MLTFERIEHKDHPYFEKAFSVYEKSFPAYERRAKFDQIRALADSDYFFYLIKDQQGEFLGILLLWEHASFVYIEHFAIKTEARGNNIGSDILEQLKVSYSKPIILEIDPPTDDISIRRKGFYQRVGFILSEQSHVHPSYGLNTKEHTLKIMSYPATSKDLYTSFKTYLDTRIMLYSEFNR